MIDVVNLTQHYGVRPILKDVNLRFPKGQLAVVVGPNGMGKSTLLGAMAGILSPQRGHVAIDGRIRRSSVEDELPIRRMTVYLPDQAWLPMPCRLTILAVRGNQGTAGVQRPGATPATTGVRVS